MPYEVVVGSKGVGKVEKVGSLRNHEVVPPPVQRRDTRTSVAFPTESSAVSGKVSPVSNRTISLASAQRSTVTVSQR